LSLREKDVIATFNWDPLLFAACARNHTRTKLPYIIYLHGNVAIGYCNRSAATVAHVSSQRRSSIQFATRTTIRIPSLPLSGASYSRQWGAHICSPSSATAPRRRT
jgi:hypothetical protein